MARASHRRSRGNASLAPEAVRSGAIASARPQTPGRPMLTESSVFGSGDSSERTEPVPAVFCIRTIQAGTARLLPNPGVCRGPSTGGSAWASVMCAMVFPCLWVQDDRRTARGVLLWFKPEHSDAAFRRIGRKTAV